jgi:uncharacterized protein YeaO (DUF488 family)
VRRVYEPLRAESDGHRVLVDRLWPRGLRRADAALDDWLKEAAPSADLRRWYGHDVPRFEEFARRYRTELEQPPAAPAIARLRKLARAKPLTLLTATRDVEHSGAVVLLDYLLEPSRSG